VSNICGVVEADSVPGMPSPLSFDACLCQDVTNLGWVVGTESGLEMPSPLILGPDVTKLGGFVAAESGLGMPSPLILGPDVTKLGGIVEAESGL